VVKRMCPQASSGGPCGENRLATPVPLTLRLFSTLPRGGASTVIDVCWEQTVALSYPASSTRGDFRKRLCTMSPPHPNISNCHSRIYHRPDRPNYSAKLRHVTE
ncbi:MAG: hypothetical protein ABI988_04435, partial [Nitrospirota bacterium]